MTKIIKFASRQMPNFNFSNFALWKVMIDRHLWHTTEHYYQASKFEKSSKEFLKVQTAKTPSAAAKLGRTLKMERPDNWDNQKDDVMWTAIKAKFDQYEHLRNELLDTGDAILVEHRKADSYWGDGGDGSGINMLGFQLMALRHIYRDEYQDYISLVCDLYKQKYDTPGFLGYTAIGTPAIITTNDINLALKLPSKYLDVSFEITIRKKSKQQKKN